MSTEPAIEESIDTAAETVGSVWPLHSFVTANPLSGFEDRPFHEAVEDAEDVLGGDGYPSADVFGRALEAGRIDTEVLRSELSAHGYDADPEASLERLAAQATPAQSPTSTATDRVDAVLTKWLSAFLDQGQAEWPMPDREQGFYEAFRTVGVHDGEIPDEGEIAALPDEPVDTIREALTDYDVGQWQDVFEFQLAALPGWTGFVKQRASDGDAWQSTYPISLEGYLAARLALLDAVGGDLDFLVVRAGLPGVVVGCFGIVGRRVVGIVRPGSVRGIGLALARNLRFRLVFRRRRGLGIVCSTVFGPHVLGRPRLGALLDAVAGLFGRCVGVFLGSLVVCSRLVTLVFVGRRHLVAGILGLVVGSAHGVPAGLFDAFESLGVLLEPVCGEPLLEALDGVLPGLQALRFALVVDRHTDPPTRVTAVRFHVAQRVRAERGATPRALFHTGM